MEEVKKDEISLKPAEHAEISPSMLNQLYLCPGAWKMQYGIKETPSQEAMEGTRLHECVARALNGQNAGIALDMEQEEMVGKCVEYAHDIGGDGAKFWTELQVYVMDGDKELTHGTCDLAIKRADGSTACVDWKFGRVAVTGIERNFQLASYALGCMHRFSDTSCDCAIFQPRIGYAGHYVFAKPDAIRTNIRNIIARCKSDTLTLCAGEEQCRFCKARNICPAFANRMRYLVDSSGVSDILADHVRVVALYEAGKTVKKFLADIESALKGFIQQSGECGGYVLQEKAGAREIRDIQGCADRVRDYLTHEEFVKCTKVSLTSLTDALSAKLMAISDEKMTKATAKKMADEIIAPFVLRAEPTVTIAKAK